VPVPAHVLVFDSGVGALSIIGEIRNVLPDVIITYASDNGFFPYGTKSEAVLVQRVDRVLHALVAQSPPDIIVIACNTASTVALPSIRSRFNIPIVGVVPAIKPAAEISASKVIGLLGTPGTVSRPYTQQLIQDFAADCQVIAVGSSELVAMAEQKLRGVTLGRRAVNATLAPLTNATQFAAMDTVVLACTHFPLIREELSEALGKPVHWVDSGAAIARRVTGLLAAKLREPHSRQETHNAAGQPGSAAGKPHPQHETITGSICSIRGTSKPRSQQETGFISVHINHESSKPRSQQETHRSVFTLNCSELELLRPHLARYLPGPVDFIEVEAWEPA
jgi:glutamate racemase